MEFNFHEEYKSYSNIDLLKIVKCPQEYDRKAIAVANQILNERVIAPEEREAVDKYYEDIANRLKAKNDEKADYKNKANEFFESIFGPNGKAGVSKVNRLLLIIMLYYAWSLLISIRHLLLFIEALTFMLFDFFSLDMLALCYIPYMFYRIIKRDKWGWILLFSYTVFITIVSIFKTVRYIKLLNESFKYSDDTAPVFRYEYIYSFFFPIAIKIVFAIVLWSGLVSNHFNVGAEDKKTALMVSSFLALFIIAAMKFM